MRLVPFLRPQATKVSLVKAENSLNAACVSSVPREPYDAQCHPQPVLHPPVQLQLELKTKEVGDAGSLSQQQGRTISELQQQIKMLESRLNPRGGGGSGVAAAVVSHSGPQIHHQHGTPRLGMASTVRCRYAALFLMPANLPHHSPPFVATGWAGKRRRRRRQQWCIQRWQPGPVRPRLHGAAAAAFTLRAHWKRWWDARRWASRWKLRGGGYRQCQFRWQQQRRRSGVAQASDAPWGRLG